MSTNMKLTYDFLSSANPHDEYELMQRIGSGTYGDVYKARHIPTASIRALKVIKLEPGDDFNIIQQEILMMIQCSHPNIIAYFGSYLKRDKLWIAMELCSGGSMQDIYHAYGPLQELQIAYILKETLKGLDYLHKNGKMHRDIKGANILLTDEGHVKLADFGVAASITATIGKRKSFIGTPYWMAPEVAAVERKGGYNHLCDIWAVGITAIEFAELQPPMFDLHPMRALFLMSKSGFKPPTLRDKIKWSLTFQNFVKYALIKNPKKRPSADRILEHPFLQGNLTSQIGRDLLERLRNGTTSSNTSENKDDEDDDCEDFEVPRKITSSKETTVVSSSNVRPLVTNVQQPSSTEDIERLKSIGVTEEDIKRLMIQVPLNALKNLALTEIKHIVDVMREADVEENEELDNNDSTIKRAPKSNIEKDQQTIDEDTIDTNNNTLKQSDDYGQLVQNSNDNTIQLKSDHNGIPSVPRVHMGAGFMKIFNQCPLEIHASYSWINNETKDQYILIAAEEGIYSLNLSELHDASLELLDPRRSTWLFTKDNVLWSISGKSSSLYRHDLILLMQNKISTRSTVQSNKFPIHQKFEKFIPKKSVASVKINNTRGCLRCCVGRNQFNGYIYLAGMLSNEIFLMQYYEPLHKFMHLKTVPVSFSTEPRTFELIFSADNQYAYVCLGVSQSKSSSNSYKLAVMNFETETFENCTDVPLLSNISHVIQHEKDADTVLVCQGKHINIVNSHGKTRPNKETVSALDFDFDIQSLVCLQDSVLAFHEHGMQGRSLKDNEIIQEIYDPTRVFRVIGRDRMIILQSRSSSNPSQSFSTSNTIPSDLHLLMGHENT